MTAVKRKQKMASGSVTLSNLRSRCRARNMTITQLAERIGQARNMVYLAVEKPSRYSGTYQRILDALQ
jgi:hypothetical protein